MSYALAKSVNWNPDFMKTKTDQQQTESALAPCPGSETPAAGGGVGKLFTGETCERCQKGRIYIAVDRDWATEGDEGRCTACGWVGRLSIHSDDDWEWETPSEQKAESQNDESSDLRTVTARESEQREPQVRCDEWLADPRTTPARETQKEPAGERAEFPRPTN